MLTRSNQKLFIEEHLDASELPENLLNLIEPNILPELTAHINNKSHLVRFIFTHPGLTEFTNLSNKQIAKFLRIDDSIVSRVRNSLSGSSYQNMNPKFGRPSILPEDSESRIKSWVYDRISSMEYPTFAIFKEMVMREINNLNPGYIPSKQYFYDLFNRLSEGQFTIKTAFPLDPQRYNVESNTIIEFFQRLSNLNIEHIDPKLIINVDETGFGSSKSEKGKHQKVTVPSNFLGTPVFETSEQSRYITCISSATLSGALLRPGFIINRKHTAKDHDKCAYSNNSNLYYSTSAFISENIFNHYIRTVIIDYVESVRATSNYDKRCLLIVDGHKCHCNETLRTLCAQHGILLILLPPHSSHLLQPLDQLIFKKMKSEYSQFGKIEYLSKISSSLERVFNAYQASNVIWIIWMSWHHCGFIPNVQNGICQYCTLDCNTVLLNDSLQHSYSINEVTRGRQIGRGEFGVFNLNEIKMINDGYCPFCHHKFQ